MNDKTNIKRKILTDRNFPNSKQISNQKDFNHIHKNYNMIQKGLLKKVLAWGGAIVGTAIAVVAIYLNQTISPAMQKLDEKEPNEETMETYIRPPFSEKETPFSTYRVCVKMGGIINYETGSTLIIPPNAFLNSNDKSINDSIDIKYREFHNPYDIFLSGIPMKYDSAGIQYTFESAGMIEILAFDGKKQLKLNENTPIEISMVSTNANTDFNLYQLDTLDKNWIYKGKDKVMTNNNISPIQKSNEDKKTENPVNNNDDLIKPTIADPLKYCFNIGYDKKDFPELAAYDNVLFEVTDHNFNPTFYKINWDKISLLNSDTKGTFIVKLKKADTSITVNAKPVFNKGEYKNALGQFEAKHKQALNEGNLKEVEKGSKLKEINKELSTYNRKGFINAASYRVNRLFSIQSFGIHNIDNPLPPLPPEMSILVNFLNQIDRDTKEIKYSTIYIVEKGKNSIFRFSKNQAIQFNPETQNLIWTITDKNEIAFFQSGDFNKLSVGQQNGIRPVVAKSQEMALTKIRNFSN